MTVDVGYTKNKHVSSPMTTVQTMYVPVLVSVLLL
jgi:hypothetical protein